MFLLVPPAVLIITDDLSHFTDFFEFLRRIYTPWVSKVTELDVSKSQNKQQKKFLFFPKLTKVFIFAIFKSFAKPMHAFSPSKMVAFQWQRYGSKKDFWVLHNFFPLTVWWQNTLHKCIGVEYTSERHKTNA